MNKTGPQLVEISPLEGEPIREKYQVTDKLYAQLKADVKQRAAALDEAISQSTQVCLESSMMFSINLHILYLLLATFAHGCSLGIN